MKAMLLKKVIINEGTKQEVIFAKGTIIEVFYNPEIDESSVYIPYQLKRKTYRHWFKIINLPQWDEYADVKIIDTEGYNLEKAVEIIIEKNNRILNNKIAQLRKAFKI